MATATVKYEVAARSRRTARERQIVKGLLKAGDFAKMCGTTKETLRHYRSLGLLNPEKIDSNGYRLYGPSQVVEYMTILSLKEAGCELSEIKEYLSSGQTTSLQRIFKDRISDIERKQTALEERKNVLEGALARLNDIGNWNSNPSQPLWREKDLGEAHYIGTLLPLNSNDPSSVFEALAEHEAYCRNNYAGMRAEWQKTYHVSKDVLESGNLDSLFSICTRVNTAIESERLLVRPKGHYFQVLDGIPLSSDKSDEDAKTSSADNPILSALARAYRLLELNGYRSNGDIFIAEMSQINHLSTTYLSIQISIRID